MALTKTKIPSRPPKKAAASPIPTGPIGGMEMVGDATCGHSSCGRTCQVRYVGPTTNLRDHHIVHAARGISNVWTASIVAGLAVVLTGAIAYSAVEAAPMVPTQPSLMSLMKEIKMLGQQVHVLQASVKELKEECAFVPNETSDSGQDEDQAATSSTF